MAFRSVSGSEEAQEPMLSPDWSFLRYGVLKRNCWAHLQTAEQRGTSKKQLPWSSSCGKWVELSSFCFILFFDRVLYIPAWPWLWTPEPPASVSWVLALQGCPAMPRLVVLGIEGVDQHSPTVLRPQSSHSGFVRIRKGDQYLMTEKQLLTDEKENAF